MEGQGEVAAAGAAGGAAADPPATHGEAKITALNAQTLQLHAVRVECRAELREVERYLDDNEQQLNNVRFLRLGRTERELLVVREYLHRRYVYASIN